VNARIYVNGMKLSWTLRLAVSFAVLALLLWLVPVRELVAAIARVPPALWAFSVVVFVAGHVISAFKWQLLFRDAGSRGRLPPQVWLRAHFAGLAANLCLPGVAGGDVVRAAWMTRRIGNLEQVAVASVADRLIDCVALLTLAAAGAFTMGAGPAASRSVLIAAAAFLGLGTAAAVTLVMVIARRPGSGLLQRLAAAAVLMGARPWLPVVSLVLSLFVQFIFLTINMQLGVSVGVNVPLAGWLVAWPLAKLVALAPISLAGLGVREAALVAFMRPFGAPAAAVTAAGLLWQAVLVTGGLIGWLVGSSTAARRTEPSAVRTLEL